MYHSIYTPQTIATGLVGNHVDGNLLERAVPNSLPTPPQPTVPADASDLSNALVDVVIVEDVVETTPDPSSTYMEGSALSKLFGARYMDVSRSQSVAPATHTCQKVHAYLSRPNLTFDAKTRLLTQTAHVLAKYDNRGEELEADRHAVIKEWWVQSGLHQTLEQSRCDWFVKPAVVDLQTQLLAVALLTTAML